MTTMTNLNSLPTTVLLDSQAYQFAQQFAAQEATPQERERVFLNTLAVCAVHNYLKLIDTETDLEHSDSWHPVKRSLFNVADLVVPNLGRLECLPVKPQETYIKLPQARDRIAYVAVQFSNEKPDQVDLLGYVVPEQVSDVEAISLTKLKPFEDLFEYLYELEEAQIAQEVVSHLPNRAHSLVRLGQWLKKEVQTLIEEAQTGWQTLEELTQSQPKYRFVDAMRSAEDQHKKESIRGKIVKLNDSLIFLKITLWQEEDQTMSARVRVRSMVEEAFLPPTLKLMVVDESGEEIDGFSIESGDSDRFIELATLEEIQSGEQFGIELILNGHSLVEYFIANY